MKQSQFKTGVIYAMVGSLWWGILGTIFFKYISYMGAIEVTLHRLIWTSLILFITTLIFKKINILNKIFKERKKSYNIIFFKCSNFFELGHMDICSVNKQNNRCELRLFYFPNIKCFIWIYIFERKT